MTRKHHHVVSRGYQRLFASGEQLLYIDWVAKTFKLIGTRDAFAEKHFNSWKTVTGWNDDLEDEWQRVENVVLPRVRRLLSGAENTGDREAVKVLAAIHFARSYAFRDAHERIGVQLAEEFGASSTGDEEFRRLYAADKGHDPEPDEIETYIKDRMRDLREDGSHFLERMVAAYEFGLGHFEPMHVQLLHARGRVGFVLGDTPLVAIDTLGFRVGIRDRLALGDANAIAMTLGRRTAMTLWGQDRRPDPDQQLDRISVQRLNLLVARATQRYLACDPAMDPTVLLSDQSLKRVI
jgi:hypothetical protein